MPSSTVVRDGLATGVWWLVCKELSKRVSLVSTHHFLCRLQSCHAFNPFHIRFCTVLIPVADIPITTPSFYANDLECPDEKLAYVFRSSTDEEIPLLQERIDCLREAGRILEDVRLNLAVLLLLTNFFSTLAALLALLKPPTTVPVNLSTFSLTISHASVMIPSSKNVPFAS
jgi:hypothetical protein